jgi:lipase ATG15
VCGCFRGSWKCNQDCLQDALVEASLFYPVGTVSSAYPLSCPVLIPVIGFQGLYNNITLMFPNANIQVTGHTLGGALASLLGITFGASVVTFEPPGERMAAQRLHLSSPVRTVHHPFHFRWVNIYLLDTFAYYSPHHPRMAHSGSDRNGYM